MVESVALPLYRYDEPKGGDPQRIAIAQSLRVILEILILPPLFWALEDSEAPMTAARGSSAEDIWLLLLPVIIPLGRWLRLPTPALLAPLLLVGTLGILDIASLQLPDWGMNIMLWVLGSSVGARFEGLTGKRLGHYALQAGVATALALAVLAVFAELIHLSVGVPLDVALLALAPGGIGEMAIVAVALGLDSDVRRLSPFAAHGRADDRCSPVGAPAQTERVF